MEVYHHIDRDLNNNHPSNLQLIEVGTNRDDSKIENKSVKCAKYSSEENQLLLYELELTFGNIIASNMEIYASNWPGFFRGQERSAYALYRQTINLAKKNNIEYHVQSIPKRDRTTWKKRNRRLPGVKKKKHYEQVLSIIHGCVKTATEKATSQIIRLIDEIIQENTALKEETKRLLPYERIVEQKYQKELNR